VANKLVSRFAKSAIQVHAGARRASDLGRRTAATDALAAALRERPLTYVALGPLTNLATFQALHPELTPRIKRVIFVGGESSETSLHFGRGGWLKIHDANVVKDRAAVGRVLASRLALTLAPAETGARIRITAEDRRRLARSNAAGKYLASRTGVWLTFWRHAVAWEGGPVFDSLAILAAGDARRAMQEPAFARLQGERLLLSPRYMPGSRKVMVCSRVGPEAKREIVQRLAR
jgi:inosine-uridine nucleoside N-ribohydrolase